VLSLDGDAQLELRQVDAEQVQNNSFPGENEISQSAYEAIRKKISFAELTST
jgi:hypothetical protein